MRAQTLSHIFLVLYIKYSIQYRFHPIQAQIIPKQQYNREIERERKEIVA